MTAAASMKLPPPLLAVLAVGAVWFLSQRRAVAAPRAAGAPTYGTQAALSNGAVRSFQVPVAGYLPQPQNPIVAGINAVASIFTRSTAPARVGGAADQVRAPMTMAQADAALAAFDAATGTDQEVIRPADYVATWTPDNAGEEVARRYYLDNRDSFIASPPPLWASSGDVPTGGYLDGQ